MMHVLKCSQCDSIMGLSSIPFAVCKTCALSARDAFNKQHGEWGDTKERNIFIHIMDSLQGPIHESLLQKRVDTEGYLTLLSQANARATPRKESK